MTDHVRLSLYCPTCLPGYHLPFFSGLDAGVFADHGIELSILEPPPPPGTTNTVRVAEGGAEFGLTGVTYFLQAQHQASFELGARFVAALHRRSPLAAVVAAASPIRELADLAGHRVARSPSTGWQVDELLATLTQRGLGAPRVVPVDYGDPPFALGRGDVDIMATAADAGVTAGTKAGFEVRVIPVGGERYTSGVIAADTVADSLVARMAAAVADAFEAQRREPEAGVELFCARFPAVSPTDARASWDLLVPSLDGPEPVGTMDPDRWEMTLSWLSEVHGFGPLDPRRVYRRLRGSSTSRNPSPSRLKPSTARLMARPG